MAFHVPTSGDISVNARYQERTGVGLLRKALSLSTICNPVFVTETEKLIKELRERYQQLRLTESGTSSRIRVQTAILIVKY